MHHLVVIAAVLHTVASKSVLGCLRKYQRLGCTASAATRPTFRAVSRSLNFVSRPRWSKVLYRGTIGVLYTSTPVPFQGSESCLCTIYVVLPPSSCRRPRRRLARLFGVRTRKSQLRRRTRGPKVSRRAQGSKRRPSSPADTLLRGSASRIGLKQQNINKEALQTVRPRTWRSVRSTPHQ